MLQTVTNFYLSKPEAVDISGKNVCCCKHFFRIDEG